MVAFGRKVKVDRIGCAQPRREQPARSASTAGNPPTSTPDGRWGKGSGLVFRACMSHLKPIFVAGKNPPPIRAAHYRIVPGTLFELVSGYWAVPEGGQCGDEL